MRNSYDVVIIGGGVHGLATAYYLAADHGVRNVAVLEKSYIGSGGSGRNTAILRSNYLTPEGVRFYDRSVKLYEHLAAELQLQCDVLPARPPDPGAQRQRRCARCAGAPRSTSCHGVDSDVIGPDEIKKLVPYLDTSASTRYPILGALYHPPGGIVRHDAVVWGYARAADANGVHIHQQTEVVGIDVDGRPGHRGADADGRRIAAGAVVNATAGWSTLVSDMVGVRCRCRPSRCRRRSPSRSDRSWTP